MNNILVSIIIPCYNGEKYIYECLNSVLNQTYKNIEVILINDCSNDDTILIFNELANNDERLILLNNSQNMGVAYCRNLGIETSNGDYLCFLDSDDTWELNKIQKQLVFMLSNNYSLCYTYYTKFGDNVKKKIINKLPNSVTYRDLLFGNCIPLSSVMLKSDSIGDLRYKNIGHEDYLFWLSYLNKVGHGYLLNKNLMFYRIHSNSISYNKFKAISFTWIIYRHELKFNFWKSFLYFTIHIIRAVIKRYF
jgi:teichuronic acid biosynthesis glycosyltransferase TuaG